MEEDDAAMQALLELEGLLFAFNAHIISLLQLTHTPTDSAEVAVAPSSKRQRFIEQVEPEEAEHSSPFVLGEALLAHLSCESAPRKRPRLEDGGNGSDDGAAAAAATTPASSAFHSSVAIPDTSRSSMPETRMGMGEIFTDCVFATSLVSGKKIAIPLRPAQPLFSAPPAPMAPPGRPSSRIQELFCEIDERGLALEAAPTALPAPPKQQQTRDLLFRRHTPTAYTDLVTDERLNRSLLRWLLRWKKRSAEAAAVTATPTTEQQAEDARFAGPAPVVLLAGGPGVGKTTMAHVIAQQAGFVVHEVNASDARTAAEFDRAVADAATTPAFAGSLLSGGKPMALLIDEIDGMAGSEGRGVVDLLVRMVKTTITTRKDGPRKPKQRIKKEHQQDVGDNDEGSEEDESDDGDQAHQRHQPQTKRGMVSSLGKKKRKAKENIIRRPVICTCNDMYSPALRELRKIVQVYTVHRPTAPRFLEAMKAVCKAEGIAIDGAALSSLCELSNFDMRCALNTLEFARCGSDKITREALLRASVGEKDVEQSLFDIWHAILQAQPLPKGTSSVAMATTATQPATTQRGESTREFNELHRIITATGDWDKVLDGCWTNYTRIDVSDHLMSRTIASADWLCFADYVNGPGSAFSHGVMTGSLVAAAALAFRSVGIASRMSYNRPDFNAIVFPKIHGAMWNRKKELAGIASAFLDGLPADVRCNVDRLTLETEFLPFYLTIISPSTQVVANKQLMGAEDKSALSRLACNMVSYNLKMAEDDATSEGLHLSPCVCFFFLYAIAPPYLQPCNHQSYPATRGIWRLCARRDFRWSTTANKANPFVHYRTATALCSDAEARCCRDRG